MAVARSEDLLGELAGTLDCIMRSSLQVPFIVVSDQELVQGVPVQSAADFAALLLRLDGIVGVLEAERAVLLADFEGEMPGFGGELVTAALVPTGVLDQDSLQARSTTLAAPVGVLVDLRCSGGQMLVRRAMESSAILKVMWGANGDITSLRHQAVPFELRISPRAVLDAQLAFSTEASRLGMARMLDRVPQELLEGLPPKECIDFNGPHSQNQRAMALPLTPEQARYAVDDLHRLEVILQSQAPPDRGYAAALALTDQVSALIAADLNGLAWLKGEMVWFDRQKGLRRMSKAVQLARHIRALRVRGATLGRDASFVDRLEAMLQVELSRAGVQIPDDLSFAS